VGSRFLSAGLKSGDCLGYVSMYVDSSIKVDLQEVRNGGVG
jgi:hypothetical protein